MQDTATLTVITVTGDTYRVDPSDELRDLLIKELEFGVNLPIDQEFELMVVARLHHTV